MKTLQNLLSRDLSTEILNGSERVPLFQPGRMLQNSPPGTSLWSWQVNQMGLTMLLSLPAGRAVFQLQAESEEPLCK